MLIFLALQACSTDPDANDSDDAVDTGDAETDTDTGTAAAPAWDDPGASIGCDPASPAGLLDDTLLNAALDADDLGFDESIWRDWERSGYVRGPYQWPHFEEVHHDPRVAACFARQHAADLDAAATVPHPTAAALGVLYEGAGIDVAGDPIDARALDLATALTALVEAAGGGDDPTTATTLPVDLAEALTPIVLALAAGIDARHVMDDAAAAIDKPHRLFAAAAGLVISSRDYFPPLADAAEHDAATEWFLSDEGPRALLLPARQLAFAVEDANLVRFAGTATDWTFQTDAGTVRIGPSTDDTYVPEDEPTLFLLELGGDDRYTTAVGGNANADNPVALHVDLGGNDQYGYEVVPDSDDVEGALPSDDDGRSGTSSSDTGRQGSGRYGIGMAFDLGGGDDTWASLRMSQAFGALGIGVLRDDGGADHYSAEAGAQASGVFGWGLLLDGGGDDTYKSWAYSQGFAYAGSSATLLDVGGDDVYTADPGSAFGGLTLYYSPQLPGGEGNSSFCQGAGFGLRGDSWGLYLSGGFGMLRDVTGNDDYVNGVFGQGTGYWEGTGLLSDGSGDDQYDALYYIQGGVAHYATGMLFDGGGDDRYNQRIVPYYMQTGAGHDYSLGMLVDDGGDDMYRYGGLAVGASNCQGVGIFVDKDGVDSYEALSAYSTGLGNHSDCSTRVADPSIGLFMDSGSDVDTWIWPVGDARTPANDSSFGLNWHETDDEHGGAVDGDGVTGF